MWRGLGVRPGKELALSHDECREAAEGTLGEAQVKPSAKPYGRRQTKRPDLLDELSTNSFIPDTRLMLNRIGLGRNKAGTRDFESPPRPGSNVADWDFGASTCSRFRWSMRCRRKVSWCFATWVAIMNESF